MSLTAFILLQCLSCVPTLSQWQQWTPWQPSWEHAAPRNDLLCEITPCYVASTTENRLDKCCTCSTTTIWAGTEKDLIIEYVSVLGGSLVLAPEAINQNYVYQIVHHHVMTEIPSNICNWDNDERTRSVFKQQFKDFEIFWNYIVKIDLSNNMIGRIVDLNCLTRLDTLDLQHNRITQLSNSSFSNLTYLRILKLAHNEIKMMDPMIISAPLSLSLLVVDLGNNLMESLDITNIISDHPFCRLDYSNNQINEIHNELALKLNHSRTYGPGFVNIENNIFNTFPDFQKILGLSALSEIGQFFEFGFSFMGAQLECDCNLQPFMNLAKEVKETLWLDYMNITCFAPAKWKDIPVVDVPMAEFVCYVDVSQGCPHECACVDRPNENTTYVDCSNQNLKELPKSLPESKHSAFIHLNVSGNSITKITNVSYINILSVLDISDNDLLEFKNSDADNLENATSLILSNNPKLRTLPQMFQHRNACSVHTDNLLIDCDCDSLWIENWLTLKSCHGNQIFECQVPDHGVVKAVDFNQDILDCQNRDFFLTTISAILASVVCFMILVAAIAYQFRYEIIVLLLRARRRKNNAILPQFSHDAFLSFDEENEELTKWVDEEFHPQLEASGYKIFIPYRDLNIGDIRDLATIESLDNSRNFLLILSESYLNQEQCSWTDNEWKYGWHRFKRDSLRNIVVVNYDHVSSFDVDHPQIKAFLRVGGQIDFINRDRDIIQQVSLKLGPPIRNQIQNDNSFEDNIELILSRNELFNVDIPNVTAETQQENEPRTNNGSYTDIDNNFENITDEETEILNFVRSVELGHNKFKQPIRNTNMAIQTKEQKNAENAKSSNKKNTDTSVDQQNIVYNAGNLVIPELPRPAYGPLQYYV